MKLGRTRFYVDEDVSEDIVKYLRLKGFHVESARELGFQKREDTFHLQEARRRKCVLLTCDNDYLNHKKFPFREIKDCAIIIIRTEYSEHHQIDLGHMLVSLVDEVGASGNHNLYGLKILINGPKSTLYKLINGQVCHDETFYWDGNRELFTR
jgi:predicted nuclease of predicted toxin-antitoxin system